MYRQEAVQLKAKLDKFVADGADEWDIKNAVCGSDALFHRVTCT